MINQIISKSTKIKPDEFRAVILSFAFIFSILAAYYIIRAVRDGLSSNWSDAELSTVWTMTFFISFLVVYFYKDRCLPLAGHNNLLPTDQTSPGNRTVTSVSQTHSR